MLRSSSRQRLAALTLAATGCGIGFSFPTHEARAVLGSGIAMHPPTSALASGNLFAQQVLASTGGTSVVTSTAYAFSPLDTISVSGGIGSVTTTFVSTGILYAAIPGGSSPGTYTLTVRGPGGAAGSATLTLSASPNPATFAQQNLVVWGDAAHVVSSGGFVSQATDESWVGSTIFANNFAQSVGSQQPPLVASDAKFLSQPSLTFASATPPTCLVDPILHRTWNGSSALVLGIVVNSTGSQAANNSEIIGNANPGNNGLDLRYEINQRVAALTTGGSVVTTNPIPNSIAILASIANTANATLTIQINNGVAATSTSTFPGIADNKAAIGCNVTGNNLGITGSVAAWIGMNTVPTTAQATAFFKWAAVTYGAGAPTFTTIPPVSAGLANQTIRISGTNFDASTTVTSATAGIITVTGVGNEIAGTGGGIQGTYLEATITNALSVGTYDLTITNATTASVTSAAGLVAQVADTPQTIAGADVILWVDPSNPSNTLGTGQDGGSQFTVTAIDMSGIGQNVTQAVANNRIGFTLSDPLLDGGASWNGFGATAQSLANAALNIYGAADAGQPDLVMLTCADQTGTVAATLSQYNGTGTTNPSYRMLYQLLEKPSAEIFNAVVATWGTTQLNTMVDIATVFLGDAGGKATVYVGGDAGPVSAAGTGTAMPSGKIATILGTASSKITTGPHVWLRNAAAYTNNVSRWHQYFKGKCFLAN